MAILMMLGIVVLWAAVGALGLKFYVDLGYADYATTEDLTAALLIGPFVWLLLLMESMDGKVIYRRKR